MKKNKNKNKNKCKGLNLRVADLVSEEDRIFFERNPKEKLRIRPFRVGEVPDQKGINFDYMLVWQVEVGARIRTPYNITMSPEIIATIHHAMETIKK